MKLKYSNQIFFCNYFDQIMAIKYSIRIKNNLTFKTDIFLCQLYLNNFINRLNYK